MAAKTLRDKLQAIADDSFVGRQHLCDWFVNACRGSGKESVLFVHGPGGVGKTTLIRRLGELGQTHGRYVIQVDGRVISPTSQSFLREVGLLTGVEAGDVVTEISNSSTPVALLVDTFENLDSLEPWLVREFIAALPESSLIVLVGRNKPGDIWSTEPGWRQILRVEALRNFSRADSIKYLSSIDVPSALHDDVIRFSHGHPLALSLFVEVFRQRPTVSFRPEEDQNIIKTLLDRFIQKVPSQAHRAAVESCAVVKSMTEDLLAAMLDSTDVRELFGWLRDRSFVETGADGIFPHDLARNVLSAELKWRNPDWYRQLHNRARKFYSARLHASGPAAQESVLFDYIYLHRDNPVVKPFFGSLGGGAPTRAVRGRLSDADRDSLSAIVKAHEGAESASTLNHWMELQSDQFVLYKNENGNIAGFLFALALDRIGSAKTGDSVTDSVATYLSRQAPLVEGERATFFRFWMAGDSYQGLSRTQTQLFVEMVRHYLVTPRLAYTFLPVESPDFWGAILEYADLQRVSALDYSIGDRSYGVYAHDWRSTPPDAWLDLLGNREVGSAPQQPKSKPVSTTAHSKEVFSDALDDALKHYTQPWKLTDNALLLSAVVNNAASRDSGVEEKIVALQAVIAEATNVFNANPKLEKARRAVERTYLKPAGTQELAAEALDLPFSTYRRHLKKGVTVLLETLWLAEIGQ